MSIYFVYAASQHTDRKVWLALIHETHVLAYLAVHGVFLHPDENVSEYGFACSDFYF